MTKNEREIQEFEMDFKKSFFFCHFKLTYDDIISYGPGLTTGMDFTGQV